MYVYTHMYRERDMRYSIVCIYIYMREIERERDVYI